MVWSKVVVRREPHAGHAVPDDGVLEESLRALRAELGIPTGFDERVEAEAREAAARPALPDADWTDVPFVTVDPPGATDLDQALHVERRGHGYRVRYAIADVPAFVRPGSAVDAEARRRGQTLYAPDARVPLHPRVLSEGAASLLPGGDRPAFVWVLDLDADGRAVAVDVVRALVRSRAQLTYEGLQADLDAGRAPAAVELLPEVGRLRVELERERGGADLAIPEQEVVRVDGVYRLRFRPPLEVEGWNAQVSLLTGMAAADLMLAGGIGVLRTLPEPDRHAEARFHRQAAALGHRWDAAQPVGEFLRGLDADDPRQLALLHESAALFRGAGYTPFDGAPPEVAAHAAVASAYAHVTAPLRRLVDRFGLVVCHALCRGEEVPGWVRSALPQLPDIMAASDRLAGALDRGSVDAAEAAVLADRVGETFDAVVVDVDERSGHGDVQLVDPPVVARCAGDALELGDRVTVRLAVADVRERRVRFER
ncbi:MAG: RNB domain-containing ribonuclease [Actinomycetes bacterium]